MTGPEHYQLAEAKLDLAQQIAHPDSGHSDEDATRLVHLALLRAQVHATLALAATWADFTRTAGVKPKDYREVKP